MRRVLRSLAALVLFLAGGAVTAFGVVTVTYRDPLRTSLIILSVGLLLCAVALWTGVRGRRR